MRNPGIGAPRNKGRPADQVGTFATVALSGAIPTMPPLEVARSSLPYQGRRRAVAGKLESKGRLRLAAVLVTGLALLLLSCTVQLAAAPPATRDIQVSISGLHF